MQQLRLQPLTIDLQGRNVFAQSVQGNHNVQLPSGVYLVNNKKVIVPW